MIITQTPLRISFLGGNTDYPKYFKKYGGAVLTTTIDKYVYCIVNKRFDDEIWVNYSIKERVTNVNDLKHELVREALKIVGITKGIEITFLSDIPSEGSGLGSSSAVTVGVLNALYHYIGTPVTSAELASKACTIEIDILKKPIGVQDQIITAYGGLRYIRLGMGTEVLRLNIPDSVVDDFNNSLMLFYTDTQRKSKRILKGVKLNTKILDRNKTLANLGSIALKEGKVSFIGEYMHEYWLLKKKLNKKVSSKQIDGMYRKARRAGATGGKILGAGGGGFLLLSVPESKRQSVRTALKDYRELRFRFDQYGSRIIFNK